MKLISLMLFAGLALAQLRPINFNVVFPQSLVEFLGLTQAQGQAMTEAVTRFSTYRSERTAREAQVRAEIAEETAREVMDVQALGVRYRELELISRQVAAEQVKNRAEMMAILTASQKEKLAALDQALKLTTTACTAVGFNLLAPPPPVVYIADFLLGPAPTPNPSNTCVPQVGIFGIPIVAPRP
ncbi:MAG: hypothetical protein K2X03_07325 [Bryobacteraceae bacterium]|nr:hypothetical protein [Bryobacteraceae bacterium]